MLIDIGGNIMGLNRFKVSYFSAIFILIASSACTSKQDFAGKDSNSSDSSSSVSSTITGEPNNPPPPPPPPADVFCDYFSANYTIPSPNGFTSEPSYLCKHPGSPPIQEYTVQASGGQSPYTFELLNPSTYFVSGWTLISNGSSDSTKVRITSGMSDGNSLYSYLKITDAAGAISIVPVFLTSPTPVSDVPIITGISKICVTPGSTLEINGLHLMYNSFRPQITVTDPTANTRVLAPYAIGFTQTDTKLTVIVPTNAALMGASNITLTKFAAPVITGTTMVGALTIANTCP